MALGLFKRFKRNKVETDSSPSPDNAYDAEKQEGSRRMSRIDRPIAQPIVAGGESDDLEVLQTSVGKQMELEQDNAIKYRTCSWPKVIRHSLSLKRHPIHTR